MIDTNGIRISNIYYMLVYAYKTLDSDDIKDISDEAFTNIYDMFSYIVSTEMAKILKQGIYKTYITIQDKMPVIRGKILISDTIKNMSESKKLVTCEFDDYSENNIYNQIVKTTMIYLLHQNISNENQIRIKKILLFLDKVNILDPKQIKWRDITIRKEIQAYRFVIIVCRYILEDLILTEESGDTAMKQYIDEQKMYHLYEKFLLGYYKYHYRYINASAMTIKWNLDDGFDDFLPKMQTDITLRYREKTLIIDAKYYSHAMQKQFDHYSLHSGNLYQLYTYVKNYDVYHTGNVSGILLYAKTQEELYPNQTYKMDGNNIGARTLDLNSRFTSIQKTLDTIVEEFFNFDD